MQKLPPEIEAQFPEQIRLVRDFYFSLSEEERKKIDAQLKNPVKKENESKIGIRKSKYCFECGEGINRSAKFCEYCGMKQPNL